MLSLIQSKDLPVSKRTRSQNISLFKDFDGVKEKPYISATEFENYCNNDKIIDWFNVLTKNFIVDENNEEHPLSFLFQKGKEYEDKIVNIIRQKTGLDLEKISSVQTSREYDDYKNKHLEKRDSEKLYEKMFIGEPIIYSAYLKDNIEKLRGIPDLLIRNDYLSELFTQNIPEVPKYKSNFGNYYYIPIEIKFSTVNLQNNDKINDYEDNRFLFYKTQLFTYCKILDQIQGVFPQYAFIIGKRTIKDNNIYDSLDYPGCVNYSSYSYDYKIGEVFYKGLEWLRDVKTNGINWELNPSLYPNMKKYNHIYDKDKREIADFVGEITDLWYCSSKKRDNAYSNGIFSWKDERLNSLILDVPVHTREAVDNIIKINRGELGDYYPLKFLNFIDNDNKNEMFVDFETIRDSLDIDSYGLDEKIFLIGTWYKGFYRSFTIDNTSQNEEKRIILEFYKYLEDNNFPVCWYWYAETSMLERCLKRNDINLPNILWRDLYKVFKDENFVVKGCKNFKLKSLIKSLSNLGKIKTEKQPDECSSGMEAMIMAWKHYNIENNKKDMESIINYNKLDCKYLNVLLDFIRNM